MKTLLFSITFLALGQAEASTMIKCFNGNYSFDLAEPGYVNYSTATLYSADKPVIEMDCAEMSRQSDKAIWSCSDKSSSQLGVTLYGDFYGNKVVGEITEGTMKIADLKCNVLQ